MIEQREASERILAHVRPRPTRVVQLVEALGKFAARDVVASIALPPFDNSAMDGYAVVSSACGAGARLRVIGEQPAGVDQRLTVHGGKAVRIFTGAPMPQGADAVVMQEDVTTDAGDVILSEAVAPGEFVRRRGGDLAEGQKILGAGDRIRPQTIALLAAQGIAAVEVGGAVRAAIISTGDELAAPGTALRPGQIYESNSALLHALLRTCGVEAASVIHCVDDAAETEAAVRAATVANDVVILSGGVSVGARDYVKSALATAGATVDLWRVNVKPGKPFLFGHTEGCAIFGLPGNPVSAFVTFLLFVRPAVLRLMGAGDEALALPHTTARVSEQIHNTGDRPHYMRGVLDAGTFTPVGRQESHALFGLSRSNSLLLVNAGAQIAAGDEATVFAWE